MPGSLTHLQYFAEISHVVHCHSPSAGFGSVGVGFLIFFLGSAAPQGHGAITEITSRGRVPGETLGHRAITEITSRGRVPGETLSISG